MGEDRFISHMAQTGDLIGTQTSGAVDKNIQFRVCEPIFSIHVIY